MSETPSLPLDKLPEQWKDEARLNVLFAPFRSRGVNEKDWDSKLDFWKESICIFCKHNKIYKLQLNEIQNAFIYNGRFPTCLAIVFEEMSKTQELIPLDQFLLKKSETWSGWATDVLIKNPISWSFNKLKNAVVTTDISKVMFVHISAIKFDAKALLTNLPDDCKNNVIAITRLQESLKWNNIDSLNILLHYLETCGDVSLREINVNNNAITLVKFATDDKKLIIDCDVNIYMLGETESVLLQQLDALENEMLKTVNETKKYLTKGQKQMAKTCLRKKHNMEKRMEGKANALFNVQTMLSRLEDSKHDAHVLATYKTALESIKNNFKEHKLSEDSVANTMSEIGEVFDIHDDIQTSLAQPLNETDVDLEAELAELLEEESKGNDDKPSDSSPKKDLSQDELKTLQEQFKELNLPDVPKIEPSLPTEKMSL